jgi:hypothetical protein
VLRGSRSGALSYQPSAVEGLAGGQAPVAGSTPAWSLSPPQIPVTWPYPLPTTTTVDEAVCPSKPSRECGGIGVAGRTKAWRRRSTRSGAALGEPSWWTPTTDNPVGTKSFVSRRAVPASLSRLRRSSPRRGGRKLGHCGGAAVAG